MSIARLRSVRRLQVFLVAVMLGCSHPEVRAQNAVVDQSTGRFDYVWLDADRRPLPSQDHAAIQEMMRSARVLDRVEVGRGVTGVEKFTLENDGVRFHAAFRTVDVEKESPPAGGIKKRPTKYRDAAIFEYAAYELSELLGIGRVPPVVERRIGDEDGTLQIWMEEIVPEVEQIQRKLMPPDAVRWNQQKRIMIVFDNLIANSDRNQGNILIDRSWNLWFIDHTRAFRWSPKLRYRDKLTACERGLWKALRDIDEDTIRQRLEPFLTNREISVLLRRRVKVVDHIQELIDKKGEEAVIFDLRPPAAEREGRNFFDPGESSS